MTASEKPARHFASPATPVPAPRGESTGEEIGYFIAMITYPIVFAIFGSEIHFGWPLTWGLLFAGVGLFVAPLVAWIRIGVLSYLPQLKIGAATGFFVGVVTSIIASRNWERPSRG